MGDGPGGLTGAGWSPDGKWLAYNKSVTSVAIDLGYDSVSAFINMFKKTLGDTPKRYFNQ